MGREIRRVPPDWDHPTQQCPHSPWNGGCSHAKSNGGRCFHPLHDKTYREAATQWKERFRKWESGEDPGRAEHPEYEFWDWDGGPPDREYYRERAWTADEATHYQVYETVSEGCPVTPHFATIEELVDYLVAHGDYWDQARGDGGWSRENAESFVLRGSALSLIVETTTAGACIVRAPRDGS